MDSNNFEIDTIKDDIDRYNALKAILAQDGGKLLVNTLLKDVVHGLDSLSQYHKMNRDELVSLAARITVSLSIVRSLTRSEDQQELATELLEEQLRV